MSVGGAERDSRSDALLRQAFHHLMRSAIISMVFRISEASRAYHATLHRNWMRTCNEPASGIGQHPEDVARTEAPMVAFLVQEVLPQGISLQI